mgnify:CR=1
MSKERRAGLLCVSGGGIAVNAEEKVAVLARAAAALNAANVTWAVGASALLYFEGVTDTFNDLDLLIAEGDMLSAEQAMFFAGATQLPSPGPTSAYVTRQYSKFRLDDVDFDLLCGFSLRRKGEVYEYPFGPDHIAYVAQAQGVPVPLSPLADWFILYLLMPDRGRRAVQIARYLKAHPRKERRKWLTMWLSGRLPGDVRERAMALFGSAAL